MTTLLMDSLIFKTYERWKKNRFEPFNKTEISLIKNDFFFRKMIKMVVLKYRLDDGERNWMRFIHNKVKAYTQCSFHSDDRAQKMKNYILTGEPHGSDFNIKNDEKIIYTKKRAANWTMLNWKFTFYIPT